MQFISPPIDQSCSEVILDEEESFHIIKVLRFKKGDKIKIFDGYSKYTAKIKDIIDGKVIVDNIEKLPSLKKKYVINLYLPFIEKKEFESIIKQGTELGVDNFIPIVTKYTQGNLIPKKFDTSRFKNLIISSVKQSERFSIPVILQPILLNDILNMSKKFIVGWVSKNNTMLFYDILKIMNGEINIIVGPEGGFSDEEKKYIEKKFFCVNISSNILTTKTAAISILGCISYFLENENLF
ncbi:MAG: 16S rRNA (uracil(1498)-N(3))-methyltransferase [Elusimicrobiales bacterium]|nr:16S rRNA (uracil(1498)-N(3))-methyltransferase [Elusimicrobiales bacterium]